MGSQSLIPERDSQWCVATGAPLEMFRWGMQVDGVSSIGALPFKMDAWGVDVAVTGSQKAMSLPTGLCLMAVSEKVQFDV